MINYSVRKYEASDYANWNTFIGQAKNATFLFHRDFMEYHENPFQDYSLIVLDQEKWVAILPANQNGNEVFSHQGLTYGGLVFSEKIKLHSVIEIFGSVLSFLNQNNIEKLQLKLIPGIYCNKPAEELNYALFLAEAQVVQRNTLAVIDLSKSLTFSKIRKRGIQKGILNALVIKEEADFEPFWNQILIPNLAEKHATSPVHSLQEIQKLKKLFPRNIRQFNVYKDHILVAGTTIFETENVVHCQYISKFEKEKNLGSLDFLYSFLITEVFARKKFFDFGISNEAQGRKLNSGLSYWKESFGASTLVHDFYVVQTSNSHLLEKVLL